MSKPFLIYGGPSAQPPAATVVPGVNSSQAPGDYPQYVNPSPGLTPADWNTLPAEAEDPKAGYNVTDPEPGDVPTGSSGAK